jgi:hypothetical protein
MTDRTKRQKHDSGDHVRLAARNNAEWCDTVCRANGTAGAFTPHAWLSARRTPTLYPDAVTLTPAVLPDQVLAGIDGSRGSSIKDSFADLDLTAAGFTVLFDARWIYRPAASAAPTGSQEWTAVRSERALRAWIRRWQAANGAHDPFVATMLDDPTVLFLGRPSGSDYLAGAIANLSDGAVGISNVFGLDAGARETWAAAVAMIVRRWPGLPVVGYEHDDDALAAAAQCGFDTCGRLRIWLRQS